ncbi:MAG: DNA-formamidopyrimidine glycosylase [Patescibacteria group bacterium]|nr:DNA-formamidopyrimidine glycosylase [Patescibacteria group bacterium]MDW8279972.1 DNA-formamidopyrimidine glycosylase [bacterium]
MPELPEAEITKRKLKNLLGKKIQKFWTNLSQNLKNSSYKFIKKDIVNYKINKIKRLGKVILVYLNKKNKIKILAFHQRISGRLIIQNKNQKFKLSNHIHFIITFSDKTQLFFEDPRKFGIVWYGFEKDVLKDKYFKNLGPDILKISFSTFKKQLLKHSGQIKSALLNQKIIAGIGNILADEILWYSKIHPKTQIKTLNLIQIKKIWQASKKIINKSIKLGGTSMRNWLHPDNTIGNFQNKTFVYGKKNQNCSRCNTKIIKIKSSGRGTYLCPKCQTKSMP